MGGLYDVWPFNMASGPEFLGFYLLISVVGLLAAVLAQIAVGGHLDRATQAETDAAPPPSTGGPYRAEGRPRERKRRRLTTGWVPRADEFWAIAYVKEGKRGVANALMSVALAGGWLVSEDDGLLAFSV
jgi:hypothetical protein